MVLLLASAALTLVPLAPLPQQKAQKAKTVLSASDHKNLNGKVKKWFDLWIKYTNASKPKDRMKLGGQRRKARDAFDKEFRKKTAKKNALNSVPDLKAIFHNAFAKTYKRISVSGEVKVSKSGAYSFVAPKGYNPKLSYRMVLTIPGFIDDDWKSAKSHFDAAWKGYAGTSNTLFVVPNLEESGEDFDSSVDFSVADAIDKERVRLGAFLGPCGDIQRTYNIDRQRFILDVGQGSTYFGLRMATYFPDRFAGVIVRWPAAVDDLRLASISNLPVLLVSSKETAEDCDQLKKRLEEAGGKVSVVKAPDAWPFPAAKAEIGAWMDEQNRNLYPKHVRLEPNHDQYHNAYWVKMGTAEPLQSVAKEDRPFLEVTADREANRIEVKANNVQDFLIDLNDDLVDLTKPFTVVINGVAQKVEKRASLRFLFTKLQGTFDPNRIFTAKFSSTVPKDEEKGEEKGNE